LSTRIGAGHRDTDSATEGNAMTDARHIDGHFYPPFHSGWGGFAEELFHYTSRYFLATEAFLRNLVDDRGFSMAGYKAAKLSSPQRELMAMLLAASPEPETGVHIVRIVEAVKAGSGEADEALLSRYRANAPRPDVEEIVERSHSAVPQGEDVEPFDLFLNLAERLLMPVALRDRHVEVSLHQLAHHLDSGNSALRSNLQAAVVRLHEAGFVLRNHPHLTHSEAQAISDGDAV
jgi:hypothetical protein